MSLALMVIVGVFPITLFLWGFWNYKLGLEKGEALGVYRTLFKIMGPEELVELIAEQEQEQREVAELKRLHRK